MGRQHVQRDRKAAAARHAGAAQFARGISVLRAARELRTVRARTLMFAVADISRPDLTNEAVVSGFADVFAKPLGPSRVVNALEREGARRRGRRLHPHDDVWDDLYSLSPSMRDVGARIAHAGTLRAGVMVRGEIGTGRRVVARAIHAQQPKPARFVAVDCAAFDPDGLERELFGPPAGDGGVQDPPVGNLEHVSRAGRSLRGHRGHECYSQRDRRPGPRAGPPSPRPVPAPRDARGDG